MDNEAFTRIPLSISPDVVRTTSAAPGFSPCLSVSLAYAETDRGPHFRSAAEPDAPCASVPAVIGACQAHAALLQRWGDRRAGGALRLMASMWYRPSFAVRNTCNGATIKSRDWKGTQKNRYGNLPWVVSICSGPLAPYDVNTFYYNAAYTRHIPRILDASTEKDLETFTSYVRGLA
jgi:hypothetical protein